MNVEGVGETLAKFGTNTCSSAFPPLFEKALDNGDRTKTLEFRRFFPPLSQSPSTVYVYWTPNV